jgi:AcrR family transcriptional regulator
MVKLRSEGSRKRRAPAPRPRSEARRSVRSDGASTRQFILAAARRQVCDVGYANLNIRDIARDAGVNHALISYHFQGKRQLVLAVLDEANKTLLDRQTRMYAETSSASDQWQQACDFYQEDLKSGFVRLQMELMAASFHDPALRAEFMPRFLEWLRLLESAVDNFITASGLKVPVSSRAIAAWIGWFWVGIEAGMTLEVGETHGHQLEALEAVGILLRRFEGAARTTPASSRAAKKRSKR